MSVSRLHGTGRHETTPPFSRTAKPKKGGVSGMVCNVLPLFDTVCSRRRYKRSLGSVIFRGCQTRNVPLKKALRQFLGTPLSENTETEYVNPRLADQIRYRLHTWNPAALADDVCLALNCGTAGDLGST